MRAAGILLIVLSLVIGIVPQFTDCASQGKALVLQNGKTVPMKCHWTAEAEIATAGPLLLVGGLMAWSKKKEHALPLGLMATVLGIFIALLPTGLIGVCANPDMLCNMLMKPTLIFSGIVSMVVGLANVFVFSRSPEVAVAI